MSEYISDLAGWPLARRKEHLAQIAPSGSTDRLVFMGKSMDLPIFRVPIELPKYRLANGRTATAQLEYLARNPSVEADFFFGDPERSDVQVVQHQLLKKLIGQSGLKRKFDDPATSQVDPIVLDSNGYVINGNRRLCTWRTLFSEDSAKWQRYSHVDVVVLPASDEQAIDQLEAHLQVERDVRADYTWESQAVMMKQRRDAHALSDEQLATLYGLRIADIKKQFEMLDMASEYLRSRGKADMWSEVSDNELAFAKLVDGKAATSTIDSKTLFKETAFALIDEPSDVGERLYKAIPEVRKYLEPIKAALLDEFPVERGTTSRDDPFGDGEPVSEAFALAAEIAKTKNSKLVRVIVRDVIDAQRSAERDEKSAQYLVKLVQKANAGLETAVTAALNDTSDTAGLALQLDALSKNVEVLRSWLNAKN